MKTGIRFTWIMLGVLAVSLVVTLTTSRTIAPQEEEASPAQIGEVPPPSVDSSVAVGEAETPSAAEALAEAGPAAPSHAAAVMADPLWKPFTTAEVVESRESKPDAQGLVERVRVVKVAMKYPLVRIEETVRAADPDGVPVRFSAAVADHMVVRVKEGLSEEKVRTVASQHGFSVRKKMLAPDTYLIAIGKVSVDALPQAMATFRQELNVVRHAEPDMLVSAGATVPNDADFSSLWGMHQANDKDIDAPEAWDLTRGTSNVVVAVIDTGIDYGHGDLAANLWRNPGETARNGVDDDGNGFVDDVYGWDFCNEDSDPYDDNSHGTHCAGIIGGVGNNGVGVAGVNWNVRLMALKVLNQGGNGYISDAIDAIYYATQRGVRLTSNSWGHYGDGVQSLKDAIDDAGTSNILFVAAAGNAQGDNDVDPMYPASFDSANIVSVAATDANDGLAWFSNLGLETVDLGAPGVDIYSTVPVLQGSYGYMSGSSMAAPQVAGACALVAAHAPGFTAGQIKQQILGHTDPVSALAGRTVSGGRLNLYKSLTGAVPPEPPAAPSGLGATPVSNQVELVWTDNATNETAVVLERRTGTAGFAVLAVLAADSTGCTDTNVAGGFTYAYRLKANNEAGSSAYSPEAVATVPGAADAWDPGDDEGSSATLLESMGTQETSHGPHTLTGTDPRDWFQVELAAGNTYRFHSIGGCGDTLAELYRDSAGTQRVAFDDDGGGGLMFMLDYLANSNATYYLCIRTEPELGNAAYYLTYSIASFSNQVPAVRLTSPGSNALYQAPASIPLAASASDPDGSIAQVQFYNGMARLSTDSTPPYGYTWNRVAAGRYTLKAVATDDRGASADSLPVSVTVNAQPTVVLAQPSNGTVFVEGDVVSVVATASDTDGSVRQVEFYDGTERLETVLSAPYEYAWSNAAVGCHRLTAVARDDQGGAAVSSTSTVTVLADHPVLTVAPTQLFARVAMGGDAPAGTLTVGNGGSGAMTYEISEDMDWLSISPANGSSGGEDQSHAVTYSTAGLAAGVYTGVVTVTASAGTGSPQAVGVRLVVSTNSLDDGLMAYYPFNGNVNDESGNGHHGTLYGGQWAADRFGRANETLYFNGEGTDYVDMQAISIELPVTVSLWFMSEDVNTGAWKTMFGWSYGMSGGAAGIQIAAVGDGHMVGFCGHPSDALYSSVLDGDGAWHMLTISRDADGHENLYVDGAWQTNTVATRTIGTNHNLYIGRSWQPLAYQNEFFKGKIDEVRIYQRALSSDEVWTLYGGGQGSISGEISYGGSQTGQIAVVANGCTNWIAGPGAYRVDRLPIPASYRVTAFLDANGNGQCDLEEPCGAYAGNPVQLTSDLTGADILLQEQNPTDSGLIAYYPFNGNVNDESGNGHHGILHGAQWIADRSGRAGEALLFDGLGTDYVDGGVLSMDLPVTVSLWFKSSERNDGPWHTLLGWSGGMSEQNAGIQIAAEGDGRMVAFCGNASYDSLYAPSLDGDGIWHMLTISRDLQNNSCLYVDGIQIASRNARRPVGTTHPLFIGRSWQELTYQNEYFKGAIDEVRIYNRALTSNEVWHLYGGSTTGSISGSVEYYGSQMGSLVVKAGVYATTLAGSGSFAISNLPSGSYAVSVFCDVNRNGALDEDEPAQSYSNNPVVVMDGEVGGVDMVLGDPDYDGDGLSDAYETGYGRYQIVTGLFTWAQAKAHAEEAGGHLATVVSAAEWEAMQQVLGANLQGQHVWLGGTDEVREGQWTWVTGEPWRYSRWQPGEPDNASGDEHYLAVNADTSDSGNWSDENGVLSGYVYEMGCFSSSRNADSDADGLNDGQEVNIYGTDPANPDTDGEGLNDGEEVATGTNPLNSDSDQDGLQDFYEVVTRPCLDPLDSDSDDDGVQDGEEIAQGGDPCSGVNEWFSITGAVTYQGSRTGQVVVTAASVVPTTGLTACYPFSGDANDASGNGHHGSVYGSEWTSDRWGRISQALSFNGEGTDYVDMGTMVLELPVTVSLWFMSPNSNVGAWKTLLGWSDGMSEEASGIQIAAVGDGRMVGFCGHPTTDALYSLSLDGDGVWHMLTISRDLDGVESLYVDGVAHASLQATRPIGMLHNLYIGRSWQPLAYQNEYFRGKIDDIRIYDRVLSVEEIAKLYRDRQYQAVLSEPGTYLITNVLGGGGYTVSAFMDCDGNGVMDADEPRGSYAANPVLVTNPVAGVDIELSVPSEGWALRAKHATADYNSPGTNTVQCEVHVPSDRSLASLEWTVSLPEGWALLSASGDGEATVDPGANRIQFAGSALTNHLIQFTYEVSVPVDQMGPKAIGGVVSYVLDGAETNGVQAADPDPLIASPSGLYHSSDCRSPKWMIDLPERNRTLSYWRCGGYGVRPGTIDGYAPNETSRNGVRHKADYQEPFWELDGEEALRVVAYWKEGGYHVDSTGVDGYAPGLATNGPLGAMDIGDITAMAGAPSTYVPGQSVTLRATLGYAHDVLGLLWRPQLPAGWTILSVQANGGTPEVVNNEILFTGKLPASLLEITYVCGVPEDAQGDVLVQTDVRIMRPGTANPQSLFGLMAPNLLQLDSDGDRLPDWVETDTGIFINRTNTGTDPNNPDTDGDGVWDGEEVPAGTNPNQNGECFRVLSLAPMTGSSILAAGSPYEIRWASVDGKRYSIFRSTNLLQGFQVIRSNLLATPPANTFIDSLPPDRFGAYSIGVE